MLTWRFKSCILKLTVPVVVALTIVDANAARREEGSDTIHVTHVSSVHHITTNCNAATTSIHIFSITTALCRAAGSLLKGAFRDLSAVVAVANRSQHLPARSVDAEAALSTARLLSRGISPEHKDGRAASESSCLISIDFVRAGPAQSTPGHSQYHERDRVTSLHTLRLGRKASQGAPKEPSGVRYLQTQTGKSEYRRQMLVRLLILPV